MDGVVCVGMQRGPGGHDHSVASEHPLLSFASAVFIHINTHTHRYMYMCGYGCIWGYVVKCTCGCVVK